MATSKRATLAQANAIAEIVKRHCRPVGENLCEYEPGWSDKRVIEESGLDLNVSTATTIRRELFGQILKPETSTDAKQISELRRRLDRLEWDRNAVSARCDQAETRLADLERRIAGFELAPPLPRRLPGEPAVGTFGDNNAASRAGTYVGDAESMTGETN